MLTSVDVAKGKGTCRKCPVCDAIYTKGTPQHMAIHGLTPQEACEQYPQLGFTSQTELNSQPNGQGLFCSGKVNGLVVAGEGFEPPTFGL